MEQTFYYKDVAALECFIQSLVNKIILPMDNIRKFSKAYLVLNELTTDITRNTGEIHMAPMYPDDQEPFKQCNEFVHPTYDSYEKALTYYENEPGFTIISSSLPLLHGFVVYPIREHHLIDLGLFIASANKN